MQHLHAKTLSSCFVIDGPRNVWCNCIFGAVFSSTQAWLYLKLCLQLHLDFSYCAQNCPCITIDGTDLEFYFKIKPNETKQILTQQTAIWTSNRQLIKLQVTFKYIIQQNSRHSPWHVMEEWRQGIVMRSKTAFTTFHCGVLANFFWKNICRSGFRQTRWCSLAIVFC